MVADSEPARFRASRGKLDHRRRATSPDGAPGRKLRDDSYDLELPIEEHDIDREQHEKRVHGRRRPQKDSFTFTKIPPSEQPAHARPRILRDAAFAADDSTIRFDKRAYSHWDILRLRWPRTEL